MAGDLPGIRRIVPPSDAASNDTTLNDSSQPVPERERALHSRALTAEGDAVALQTAAQQKRRVILTDDHYTRLHCEPADEASAAILAEEIAAQVRAAGESAAGAHTLSADRVVLLKE